LIICSALADCETCFKMDKFGVLLRLDELISHNLDLLYDKMLEANLLKIIHPFSCVEISHVAKLVKLPEPQVTECLIFPC
jgi:hypothetical protein